jgi:ABC-type transporter Mla MlaB component
MKHKIKNRCLSLTLAPECTIVDVERDADLIRPLFENIEQARVDGSRVEELDAAYFQLLLSIRRTAESLGIRFEMARPSGKIAEACLLYGLSLDVQR